MITSKYSLFIKVLLFMLLYLTLCASLFIAMAMRYVKSRPFDLLPYQNFGELYVKYNTTFASWISFILLSSCVVSILLSWFIVKNTPKGDPKIPAGAGPRQ